MIRITRDQPTGMRAEWSVTVDITDGLVVLAVMTIALAAGWIGPTGYWIAVALISIAEVHVAAMAAAMPRRVDDWGLMPEDEA